MAMVAGRVWSIPGSVPSAGREHVERSGAVSNAKVRLQRLSIGCRVSVTGGGQGRRSALKAGRASSGDRTETQREENVPSSPPPPSTSTNSVGVIRGEDESTEKGAASEASADDELAAGAVSGEAAGSTGSQNLDEAQDKNINGSSPERAGSMDEIGKEISDLRRERATMGLQDSARTTGFWKGVAEETSLIDWPVFSKVLGTTGVVVAMILGSSVVLLTVNAILAASSDFLFNDHSIVEVVKPQ